MTAPAPAPEHRCIHCRDRISYRPADTLLCDGCDRLAYDGVPLSVQMSHDVGRIAELVASGAVIRATVAAYRAAEVQNSPTEVVRSMLKASLAVLS